MASTASHSGRRMTGYSRKGCSECKKAHVKCDEALPCCKRCLRRKVACVYNTKFVLEHMGDSAQPPHKKRNLSHSGQPPPQFTSVMTTNGNIGTSPQSQFQNYQIRTSSSGSSMSGASSVASKPGSVVHTPPADLRQLLNSDSSGGPQSIKDEVLEKLKLDDLVDIFPEDMNLLSMLAADDLRFTLPENGALCEPKPPNMFLFDAQWRYESVTEGFQLVEKHDPNEAGKPLPVTDPRNVDFAWTVTRVTQFCYNFSPYPEEVFDQFMQLLLILAKSQPIVQNVVVFNVSVLLMTCYKNVGNDVMSNLWDRSIRLPTLKGILDNLSDGLAGDCTFSELVTMALAVMILFSVNSCDRNSVWRSNLKNCYKFLVKAEQLAAGAKASPSEADQAAVQLFEVIREWFFGVEFLAMLSSDNGGEITSQTPVDVIFAPSPPNPLITLENGVNLLRGYNYELNPVFHKLYMFVALQRKKGYNLCGTNILQLVYRTEEHPQLITEAKLFGFDLLWQLDQIEEHPYVPLKIQDVRMDLTLKNMNRVFRVGAELFISFFFAGKRDYKETSYRLRRIIELIYAVPYYETSGAVLHWMIYLSSLVALVIRNENLYQGLIDILKKESSRGMYVQEKSIERLTYTKEMLEKGDLDHLIDVHQDYIVF